VFRVIQKYRKYIGTRLHRLENVNEGSYYKFFFVDTLSYKNSWAQFFYRNLKFEFDFLIASTLFADYPSNEKSQKMLG